jgi:hypothetical protein
VTKFDRKVLAPATARRYPESHRWVSFCVRGEIVKALSSLDTIGDAFRFPRGLVFHLSPATVDTLFVYSWALSALAGTPTWCGFPRVRRGCRDGDRGAESRTVRCGLSSVSASVELGRSHPC